MGFYNLLWDSKHGATVTDLKAAIEASRSDLHQTVDDSENSTESHALFRLV